MIPILLFLLADPPPPVKLTDAQAALYWRSIALQQAANAKMVEARWLTADAARLLDSIGCKIATDQNGNPVEPLQCVPAPAKETK